MCTATTATHCNTLQHTATHCNTLRHTCVEVGWHVHVLRHICVEVVCTHVCRSRLTCACTAGSLTCASMSMCASNAPTCTCDAICHSYVTRDTFMSDSVSCMCAHTYENVSHITPIWCITHVCVCHMYVCVTCMCVTVSLRTYVWLCHTTHLCDTSHTHVNVSHNTPIWHMAHMCVVAYMWMCYSGMQVYRLHHTCI